MYTEERLLPTREDAWNLVREYTQSESLRKHMLAVETCVRGYARKAGADEELWGLAALVHDFDYEQSILDLEMKSVKKKLKDKAFAKGVNRDDVRNGAAELGIPIEEHIAFCIAAMRENANALGLRGSL